MRLNKLLFKSLLFFRIEIEVIFESLKWSGSGIGGLRGWVAHHSWCVGALEFGLHLRLHHGRAHSGCHDTLASSSLWSRILVLERLLKLNSLDVLLVLNFFFDVLVSLQEFVVFSFSQLQSLVQVCFKLFLKGVHLVLLLLNELWLMCNNLLWPLLHVFFSLLSLKLLASNLNLMSFLILLLLCQTFLDLLHVQKLRAELECQW